MYKEDFKLLCFLAGFVLVVIGLFGLLLYGLHWANCKSFEVTGNEVKFSYGNCYVKVDNNWVPKEFVFGKAQELRIK